ncbi:CD99 antigen-like protein 2 isoform X2 [Scyliorhinus canicula]|uniref:CD99 antigen-like protein 2 isoform X2 n=1 Tax=Scyliorhinus canicula TaxID=7830 RepID=UPI0018F309BE|nr:CD99 antigen-like protein 2 isoform X2 [Scyliorhinus canicula]
MLLLRSFVFVCLTFVPVRANANEDEFDLNDALNDDTAEPRDHNDGFDLNDALKDHSTKRSGNDDGFDLRDALNDDPIKPAGNDDDFDLSDALNGDPIKPAAGGFDDSDLQDVVNGDYKPDKTNSKGQDPRSAIDLVSELVVALIGGTTEQVKRLCFSLLDMFTDQYSNAKEL